MSVTLEIQREIKFMYNDLYINECEDIPTILEKIKNQFDEYNWNFFIKSSTVLINVCDPDGIADDFTCPLWWALENNVYIDMIHLISDNDILTLIKM